MSCLRIVAATVLLVSINMVSGCADRTPTEPSRSRNLFTPNLSVSVNESWVITAYYWDDGWVPFASWDGGYLPTDLLIDIDAWNWSPDYPAFEVDYDNVYAFGDLDLPPGLVDDFNDGIINPIWAVIGDPNTRVYEATGVLNIDIPSGPSWPGQHTGGLRTDYVVHGDFDVRVDFALSPGFHSSPGGGANAKLIITEEHPPGGGFPFGAEVSVRVGNYIGVELGPHGWFQHGSAQTNDLVGKLRIARTRAVIHVNIDIKPGSDPNSINCKSKGNQTGVIPVAILTTEDFDAMTVDHTTVTFEGASETHVDKKTGEPRRHEEDVDGDGDMDLVFHFRFGDTNLTCDSTEGTLVGETYDGTQIEGTDAVRMVGGE